MKVFLSSLALSLGFVATANADTITAATVDWEPFTGKKLKNYGVFAEITQAALKAEGHELKIRFIPWKRAMDLVKKAEIDVLMISYKNKEREKEFLYSDSILSVESGFLVKGSFPKKEYSVLKDLAKYRIATFRGGTISEEFDNAKYLNVKQVGKYDSMIKMLFNKRTDIIVMEHAVATHISSNLGFDGKQIKMIKPALNFQGVHNIMSKKHPKGAIYIKALNSGLKKIKENGTYTKIVKSHNLENVITGK